MENNQIERNSTVVDMPLESVKEDLLNMFDYQEALVYYLQHAKTPISISLQGEWGSGKTSLMQSIKHDLCDSDDASFYGVWINTWQFSLLDSSRASSSQVVINILQVIINHLIELKPNSEHNEKIIKLMGRIGGIVQLTYDVASPFLLSEANKKVVDGILEKVKKYCKDLWKRFNKKEEKEEVALDKTSLVEQLKKEIDALVQEILSNNNQSLVDSKKLGFIFFIDDLDRVDPVLSVNVLENFKNIFNIEHCIFIYAVDSSVVIRGLKSKLGDLNNKSLYRSYLDKLIQIQLAMPLRYYDIKPFLSKCLVEISFFHQNVLNDPTIFNNRIDELCDIVEMSIGKNPRDLKRLINVISFTYSIIHKHITVLGDDIVNEDNEDKSAPVPIGNSTVIFILLCIQIAFPELYAIIQKRPDFVNWVDVRHYTSSEERNDCHMSVRALKSKLLTLKNDVPVKDWEVALYNICINNDTLKIIMKTYFCF